MTNNTDRLHSLDAVRAIALLLGVVLHATMSFIMPIPAADVSQSTTLSVLFFVIHIFRMSAFYLIAGFFARMVIERRGMKTFVKDRARRILIPMVGGWILLAPLLIAVLVWGISQTFPNGPPEAFEQESAGFPLLHLWFLYYLSIFYVLAIALRSLMHGVVDRSGKLQSIVDRLVRVLLSSYVAPVLLSIPLALVLYFDANWIVWAGVPTPDVGLTPQLPAMVGFGMAFGIGWLVHRQLDLLQQWKQRWPVHLCIAVILTAAALVIVGPATDFMDPAALVFVPGAAVMRVIYVACYTLAIWYWTFALIGFAMEYLAHASRFWRYLADASYWIYLAHLPIVMFFQVLLAPVALHWSIKLPLILAASMALLLLSYRFWVRHTWLGALLNGRRQPRSEKPALAAATQSQ
jgi:peptidoglycan/LPS O-acetylase OafA/YrhL